MRLRFHSLTLAFLVLAALTTTPSTAKAQFFCWGPGTMLPTYGFGVPGPPPFMYSPMYRFGYYRSAYLAPGFWGYPYIYRNIYSYPPPTASYMWSYGTNFSPAGSSNYGYYFGLSYANPFLTAYGRTATTANWLAYSSRNGSGAVFAASTKKNQPTAVLAASEKRGDGGRGGPIAEAGRWLCETEQRRLFGSDRGAVDAVAPTSTNDSAPPDIALGTYQYYRALHRE